MKRILKITLTVLLTLTLSFSFTSCAWLDELKAQRVTYGMVGEIYVGDTLYKQLTYTYNFYADGSKELNLSEQEVPLILANVFGYRVYMTQNELIIVRYESGYGESYYIREDQFDYFNKNAQLPEYINYCYYKNVKYYDEDGNANYEYRAQILDEYTKNILDMTLKTSEPIIKEFDYTKVIKEEDIYSCDETGYLVKSKFKIQQYENGYFISQYDNSRFYKIDEQYNSTIEKIFKST